MPHDRADRPERGLSPFIEQDFRPVFANLATSVAVITARDDANVTHGMTIGSLCALSLDPPLLLFCIDQSRRSHAALCDASQLCVSVLAQGQESTARRFAQAESERFAGDLADLDGLPAVPGAVCWLLCTHERVVDGGDHSIVIARVRWATLHDRRPLVYWQRGYRAIRGAGRDSYAGTAEVLSLHVKSPASLPS
jgi:flavin reductase ActVB